jgi:hypothetical protein
MAAVNPSAVRSMSPKGKAATADGDGNTAVPANLTANFAKVDTSSAHASGSNSNNNNQMWLIKIPNALMQAWEDEPEGAELGKLVFTKGTPIPKQPAPPTSKGKKLAPPPRVRPIPPKPKPGAIPQSLRVDIAPDILEKNSKVPCNYLIEAMTKKVPTLYPFTRHTAAQPPSNSEEGENNQPDVEQQHPTQQHEEGTVTLHGVVTKSATLQMQRNDQYRQLLKSRLLDTVTSKNVKSVDASELTLKTGLGRAAGGGATTGGTGNAGFGDSVQKQGKRLLEARDRAAAGIGGAYSEQAESLKRRFEGQSVRSVLFELFSQQSCWTAKELRMVSGRSEKEIRPVLQELGHYIKNGERKGMWELKSEFQMQAAVPQADGAGGDGAET